MHSGLSSLFTVLGAEDQDSSRHTVYIEIKSNADLFDIHFEGMPVVPGACLLGFVLDRVEAWCSRPMRVTDITQAAFSLPVMPRQKLRLELHITDHPTDPALSRLVFQYLGNTTLHGQGILTLTSGTESTK